MWAAVTKRAITNGNWATAGTWSDYISAAENDSAAESTNATPPTAGGATSDSSTFTPAATATNAFAIKIASVAGATGTVALSFRNNTTPGTRDYTVTVNLSDLPQSTAVSPLGWFVVKNGSAVTPNGTDTYVIRIVRSVGASSCTVYASSGNNWLREVFASAASGAAPTTGDKLVVSGEFTAAATSSTWTVTYNVTAATVFGAAAANDAIVVGTKGILSQQVTATTTYVLNYLGRFLIAGGGIWQNAGGTAMPSNSSLTVTAQNVANVDCGIEIGALGTVTLTGKTITTLQTKLTSNIGGLCSTTNVANSVVTALEGETFTGMTGTIRINAVNYTISSVTDATHLVLTSNAGAQTAVEYSYATRDNVLNVVANTGWSNNDVLCLAPSSRTPGSCESVTVSSMASLAITLTGAAVNYHSSDTSPNDIRAEVGHLTRNIKIQGLSATLGSYVNINATATVTLRYVEFTKIGSATALKRGIDVGTTTGSFDMQFCSIHDCTVASSQALRCNNSANNNITFSSNVVYNIAQAWMDAGTATTNSLTFDSNLFMLCAGQVALGTPAVVFTNNVITGNTSGACFAFNNAVGQIGTFSGNTFHSNSTGPSISSIRGNSTLTNITSWRNSNSGFVIGLSISGFITFAGGSLFGNSNQGINFPSSDYARYLFTSYDFRAGANLVQASGILLNSASGVAEIILETAVFGGGGQTHSTGDITGQIVGSYRVTALNSTFNSSTIVASQNNLQPYSFVSMQRFGTTAGTHRWYSGEATGTTDTTAGLFESPATMSLRITPIASANPTLRAAESAPPGLGFQVPVKNGNAVTLTVRVRKSVVGDGTAWNGNQPRLYVRRNVAAGISADTLLATGVAANGSWETLTGTTAAVTDDAVLEFFVDSGVGVASPAGWYNVGRWKVIKGAFYGSFGLNGIFFNGFPQPGLTYPARVGR